jgi:DNA-directed RNA polymerase specialized sigma24 family protein
MPLGIPCHCTLCDIETQLLSELLRLESRFVNGLFSAHPALLEHSTVGSVLSHLRTSRADGANDSLFREIFALRETNPGFADSLLVLVFLPMLHRAVRLINRQQESLAEVDIAQQAIFFFLEGLGSAEMQTRRSHFAFAIARELKRRIFEWAKRESRKATLLDHPDAEAAAFIELEDSVERCALLRHFLHRCFAKGLLTDSELDLLVQFKLDGNSGEELAALNGSSPNAVRQRFKRLLSKLRRLAR